MERIDQIKLSKTISSLRSYLVQHGFFEHHLYSSTPYRIRSTTSFRLKKGLYLRFNPEPDIWQIGTYYERFFWIGSLFRNEKKIDNTHQYEFTVIDIYIPQGSEQSVITLFKRLLLTLERKNHFRRLSQLPVTYISHQEFNERAARAPRPTWFIVTSYRG